MGNSNSTKIDEVQMHEIEQETGFTRSQIERLRQRFDQLDTDQKGYLIKEDFENLVELNTNPLGDRLIDAFFIESIEHPDINKRDFESFHVYTVTFRQFVKVLSFFLPVSKNNEATNKPNTRLNKLRFAFSMYDLEHNNYVTRDEFREILNTMVGTEINKHQLENIVDRAIDEADLAKDGKISFEEFCHAMQRIDIETKMSMQFTS